MKKMLCFDMDGTIADLYGVESWLPKLQAEDASPYFDASPMWDMDKLNKILQALKARGWEIQIITWLSKNSTKEYKTKVRETKKAWLKKWGFQYDHFHGVQYGRTKADSVRGKADYAILIDDNKKIRDGWTLGKTIDPTSCNLLETLSALL
jgi:hypothetical protein